TIFLKSFHQPKDLRNFPKNQAPTLVGCLFDLLKSGCRGSEEVRIIETKNLLSTLISNSY
ncbi:MAG TPA: hypothetical protein VFW53_03710, partial [Gallionella sp.]|nr:hypothetical protein [Gallionella sp.]